MVFLNPAFLFGLIAAAIPVVLHFLNLQRLKRIEFSTLAFLKELQKTKIRKLRFKQWLLLFLRVLLVLLLVAAFARPTLESTVIGGTSAAKTSSVFIIDDTFSMSVVKSNGSYFNKAKELAKSILTDYEQGDEAAVIFISEGGHDSFEPGAQKLIEELNAKNISVKKEQLEDALSSAIKLLNESQNFNKELFILSDFWNNNFSDQVGMIEAKLDETTKVYLLNFPDNEIVNRAAVNFELNNQLLEEGKTISFSADIKNTSKNPLTNGVASLFLNEKRSAQQSISLNPGEIKTVSYESVLSDRGLVKAYVELEQDDITQDNRIYTAFYVPEEINVLLAAQSNEESRFINLALKSASENTKININEINFSQLSPNLFNENDVVILIGMPGSVADKVDSFIESGGKVIVMPSSLTSSNDFNEFMLGIGVNTNINLVGKPNSSESISYFGKVEYEHPVFQNLFEDREDTKIESPEIYSYLKINPIPSLKPIISLRDNSLFLSEFEKGEAQVLIFSSAPLLSWSNFPVKSLFAPLISKSVLYQTMQKKTGQQITAGDDINIRIDNLNLPQVRLLKPDKTEEFINIKEIENRNYVVYDNTDQLGVYEIYSGEELIDFVSVNFSREETDTESSSNEKIEEYFSNIAPADNLIFIDPSANYKEEIKQARFGTELWKYFLIAALFIAIIETIVSKNSKKDFAEVEK